MFISLDLETTGFHPDKDRIIEFGAIKFDLEGNKETLQILINPGVSIPQIVTHITGIKDADVASAPLFKNKQKEMEDFIGDLPIIGHNIQFDTNFLRANGIELVNPEYDTLELTSILIPNLSSYSLEVLTQILELTHEEKHRALDDAIAAMELFLKLANKFQELPGELIEEIHAICKKTDWPLKDFLLTLNHKDGSPPEPKAKQKLEPKDTPFQEILDTKDSALFEFPQPHEALTLDLAKNANKDTYIATSHYLFREIQQDLPEEIAQIEAPTNYISPKRLKEFATKDHFENYETTAILKYIIWLNQTKTGHLSEVSFFRKEYITLDRINADPDFTDIKSEPFITEATSKDTEHPVICSHKYLIEEKPEIKELIIIDFTSFTKTLHHDLSTQFSLTNFSGCIEQLQETHKANPALESLLSRASILFGLIGLLFEKYNDKNLYTPRSVINESHFQTPEWKNISDAITSLIEISKDLADINNIHTAPILKKWKKFLTILDETFRNPDLEKETIWIEKDTHSEVVFRKAPNSLKEPIKAILDKVEILKIVDESLDLQDQGTFTKFLFGLPQNLPITKLETPKKDITIEISQDTPQNERESNNALNAYLTKNLKGGSAIACNSRKVLEYFTLSLKDKRKDLKIVSQLTGSIGKIAEQFKQDPENSALFLTTNAWEIFPNPELINHLYLHKLPFNAPSDPYLITLSNEFERPFDGLQIPLAIFRLKKAINRLPGGTLTLFDSRIHKKDYGKAFLDNIAPLATPEFFSINVSQNSN